MCPSEILNEILNTSTNEVKKIEEEYINTFAYFIKQTSGTLYYKLIESMYAEPQEYSMLLRTGFLADSLVPISIIETFYAFLKRYQMYERHYAITWKSKYSLLEKSALDR